VNRQYNLCAEAIFILVFSVLCTIVMMGLEPGGTRWLKFALYFLMFASISTSSLFSSRFSRGFLTCRSRK